MKTIYSFPLLLLYVLLFGLAIYGCSIPTDTLSDRQSSNDNPGDFDILKVRANYEEEMSKLSNLKLRARIKKKEF
ncbi:hypothetical protein DYBT9275_00153 [Dyadobacter sp. CECT 9275]|uniref:Lipoprotein n=1 Tax=Dyadobacter helix TaxID=2822344 RepID=A0A916NAM0_9BACT|nr:hypothetical protein DYBT9275_00153 [Dyadobacter sp. CECT 9275]